MQKTLLSNLLKINPDAVVIGSLGTISYDLTELQEDYMGIIVPVRGAMGCVLGIGLGMALNTSKKVIVVIGDGALLMKLGSIATIQRYKPKNLEIHVIQNDRYASTGNQEINFKYIKSTLPKSFKVHEILT